MNLKEVKKRVKNSRKIRIRISDSEWRWISFNTNIKSFRIDCRIEFTIETLKKVNKDEIVLEWK